jgi:hypothetical protein
MREAIKKVLDSRDSAGLFSGPTVKITGVRAGSGGPISKEFEMPKAEFKYHALRYLNLWVSQDRTCCEALAGTDDSEKLRALAKAAAFYRIARNLRTRYDTGKQLPRYCPVLRSSML